MQSTLIDTQSPYQTSVVRLKPFHGKDKKWRRVTVVKRLDERSYEVECNGHIYTCNREHLRASTTSQPDVFIPIPAYPEMADHVHDEDNSSQPKTKGPIPQARSHSYVDAPTGLDLNDPPTPCESPMMESQVPLRRSSFSDVNRNR